jgi:Calpain family cysteine protease
LIPKENERELFLELVASLCKSQSNFSEVNMSNPGFSSKVRSNFDQWDDDHDGYLSEDEINDAMHDGKIKGDDAAALSSLRAQRSELEELSNDEWGDENDGVTKMDLDAYDKLSGRNEVTQNTEGIYHDGQGKIASTSRSLFINNDADPEPDLDPNAIQQGQVGDCSFLAAVGSLATQRPDDIIKIITDNRDGTYTVDLPEGSVKVSAPTDTEIAQFSGSGQNGLWLSVLEKAYAQSRHENDIFTEDEAYDSLSEGIGAITGHSDDTDILSLTRENTTHEKLSKAMREGRVVTASIRHNMPLTSDDRNGLPMGHAYTVVAYDPSSRTVTVRNPWGHNELANENSQPRDGKNDGVFTLSLSEFDDNFTQVAYEEN